MYQCSSAIKVWILAIVVRTSSSLMEKELLVEFTTRLIYTKHTIVLACSQEDLFRTSLSLMEANQFVSPIHLNNSYSLISILNRNIYARTSVIVNTKCDGADKLLRDASEMRYFNKTYQWLLWSVDQNIDDLLPLEIDYVGPNAQITYVNKSRGGYSLWDIHSKGRHLKSALEVHLIAQFLNNQKELRIVQNIFELQSINHRSQFNGLILRGASVIDQEDIFTNEQIETILSRRTKDVGVAAFIKYHYELLNLLRERFNFTVHFRNSRGWAGRLANTSFRLGLLGIITRNEADIAASGAFNRINRFAEFDTIHQSWKFETAFLFRFTPDLDTQGKSGNFLAPFSNAVWLFTLITLIVINLIWLLLEYLIDKWHNRMEPKDNVEETNRNNSKNFIAKMKIKGNNYASETEIDTNKIKTQRYWWSERILNTFGAACQQGLEPIPQDLPCRSIVVTLFLFSVVMYNYYTSSVVGGLLSSSDLGPASVEEITSSQLKISFEDIGYYKVLFRESKSSIVTHLIEKKLSASRAPNELGVYSHIEEAIPFLKSGGFAFHCEVVDAYPVIAELFDANEICDLRVVSGLMEVEIMNWIVHKNSQYTEIFRTAMCHTREAGLVERILRQRQMKKPACQSLYTVYPVSISGVTSAFFTLLGGALLSLLALCLEIISVKYSKKL